MKSLATKLQIPTELSAIETMKSDCFIRLYVSHGLSCQPLGVEYQPWKHEVIEMKSDCCGAEMDTLCEHDIVFGYRCQKCRRDTVPRVEEPAIPTLTPEQVKAIRWPSNEAVQIRFSEIVYEDLGFLKGHQELAKWAIRYALQDLMPEDEK